LRQLDHLLKRLVPNPKPASVSSGNNLPSATVTFAINANSIGGSEKHVKLKNNNK
jgi:hypothetical protein